MAYRSYTDDDKERARKLHRDGMTMVDIAKTLGVPRSTVHQWIRPRTYEKREVRFAHVVRRKDT